MASRGVREEGLVNLGGGAVSKEYEETGGEGRSGSGNKGMVDAEWEFRMLGQRRATSRWVNYLVW